MKVSVEAALRRGNLLLKSVPIGLFLLCLLATILLVSLKVLPVWSMAVGLPAGMVVAWLWWSVAVTRWRIWSFTHVRNINELMDLAVNDKLIWAESSWFGRTEIRTRAQREMLQQLAFRMEVDDEVRDDPAIPDRTCIPYSTVYHVVLLIMGLPLLGFGTYMVRGTDAPPWSAFLVIAVGAWLTFDAARKLRDRSPRITISREGITLARKGAFAWGDLWDEQVITIGSGKSSRTVLKFHDASSGVQEVDIDDLKTSKTGLRHALKIHRYRWTLDQPAAGGQVPRS